MGDSLRALAGSPVLNHSGIRKLLALSSFLLRSPSKNREKTTRHTFGKEIHGPSPGNGQTGLPAGVWESGLRGFSFPEPAFSMDPTPMILIWRSENAFGEKDSVLIKRG